jgi:predicted lipoprotein with Yx(FWY)xxD motif
MKKSAWVWVLVVIVILGAWYFMATSPKEEPMASNSNTSEESNESGSVKNNTDTESPSVPLVNLATSPALGKYVVASNSMTLYTSSKDTKGVSNCTGECATTWPPYVPSSLAPITTGYGVSAGLAKIARTDGSMQLTYNGMPLYFYKGDAKPSDTKGNGVGGTWSVVTIKP